MYQLCTGVVLSPPPRRFPSSPKTCMHAHEETRKPDHSDEADGAAGPPPAAAMPAVIFLLVEEEETMMKRALILLLAAASGAGKCAFDAPWSAFVAMRR